jgi:hypothetical protein
LKVVKVVQDCINIIEKGIYEVENKDNTGSEIRGKVKKWKY